MTGYNTNGVVYPLTVTLDNVDFDGAVANDFKAPDNFNNVQFTFGPGPVNFASFLTTDAATASNYITSTTPSPTATQPYDCTDVVRLSRRRSDREDGDRDRGQLGDAHRRAAEPRQPAWWRAPSAIRSRTLRPAPSISWKARTSSVRGRSAGGSPTSPCPTSRQGTHTYTAAYSGDSNYSALSFGSFTVTAANNPAPVAASQTVNVTVQHGNRHHIECDGQRDADVQRGCLARRMAR